MYCIGAVIHRDIVMQLTATPIAGLCQVQVEGEARPAQGRNVNLSINHHHTTTDTVTCHQQCIKTIGGKCGRTVVEC